MLLYHMLQLQLSHPLFVEHTLLINSLYVVLIFFGMADKQVESKRHYPVTALFFFFVLFGTFFKVYL
jgi:hypothetical protein